MDANGFVIEEVSIRTSSYLYLYEHYHQAKGEVMNDKERWWSDPNSTCKMEDGTTRELGRLRPRDRVIVRGEVCEVVSIKFRDVRDFPEVKVVVEPLYAVN